MHRHHTFTTVFLAALISGCATAPQDPSSPVSKASPNTTHDLAAVASNAPANNLPGLQSLLVSAKSPYLVDLTAHPDDVWDRIRLGFAVPNMDSAVVVEQQAWFLSHPDFLERAAERASPYLYHITEELEKRHMPTELALLPFIESAYNPMAYSRAHASGMWQFIPSTGKNFNLKQDFWRDDRRDVVASTDAALSYLQALYEMYGDWTLALASYNWGEGSVGRAIERNQAQGKPTDYQSLNMPDETRTYYPRLQALKNIISNPAAFGITLPHVDNEPYFVSVAATRDIDVQTAAKLADMPIEDFRALNPGFNRALISASSNASLLLPTDRAVAFQQKLESADTQLVNWQAYRVKRGERLDHIAAHFGMTVAALCEANSINAKERLKPGSEILVALHHAQAPILERHAEPLLAAAKPTEEAPELPATGGIVRASYTPAAAHVSAVNYTVRRGDTLFSISQHFHTTVAELKHMNHLRGDNLQPGTSVRVAEAEKTVARR